MSGFFITGTDTEIGKTFVSTLLINFFVQEGLRVIGMKPIASGAKIIDGVLKNDDALSLIEASNVITDYKNINPYVFEPAISPHLAAEQTGAKINLDKIKKNFKELEQKSDIVIVEGVGGWYAPLNVEATISDLARALNIPIIIVVGLRLGCLNHALLTVQAVQQTGLPIAGWIANYVEDNFSSAEKNIETLQARLNDIPYLGFIPNCNVSKKNKNNVLCTDIVQQTEFLNKSILLEKLI